MLCSRLDKEKEKCVEDNTKKCSDDEKKPVEDKLDNSTKDDADFISRPCSYNPCTYNATCLPTESGKFKCECPPDSVQSRPTESGAKSCVKGDLSYLSLLLIWWSTACCFKARQNYAEFRHKIQASIIRIRHRNC